MRDNQGPNIQPAATIKDRDKQKMTVEVSMTSSTITTQEGLVIYILDAMRFSTRAGAAAHLGAAGAHRKRNTRVLLGAVTPQRAKLNPGWMTLCCVPGTVIGEWGT